MTTDSKRRRKAKEPTTLQRTNEAANGGFDECVRDLQQIKALLVPVQYAALYDVSFDVADALTTVIDMTEHCFVRSISWRQSYERAIMEAQSCAYFKVLGARITALRKARSMTQAELARAIGVSQQAVFAYELGERRTSLLVFVKVAKVFAVTVEELIGLEKPIKTPRRRLSWRAERHARRLMNLSKTHQRFVVRIIDVLEAGGKLD